MWLGAVSKDAMVEQVLTRLRLSLTAICRESAVGPGLVSSNLVQSVSTDVVCEALCLKGRV